MGKYTEQKFDSDDPEILSAYQAETLGDYLRAVEHYKKAIDNSPDLGIALFRGQYAIC